MKLSAFHYDLPETAIAQEPVEPRDHSRLMVLDRASRATYHHHFYELSELLRPGDTLVLNATRVFPARLRGKKKTGGKIELLLLESLEKTTLNSPLDQVQPSTTFEIGTRSSGATWRALVRGATQPTSFVFPEGLEARMTERLAEGEWIVEFSANHLRDYLGHHGEMPLPPYIKRPSPRSEDLDRYQTVYAECEGAVAAPTAGFHFTTSLLEKLRAKNVKVQTIILHVGWGTFRPVRSEQVEDHTMLAERYEVSPETAETLNVARQDGGRIVAVGTTAVRTLETVCDDAGRYQAGRGASSLFIYPGYRFKGVDALITNFHLPDSTPLLLANAFFGGTADAPFPLKPAYTEAIAQGYRFYSYGDAMFIQ